uniref:Forkhead box A n=1 Tax=Schmidtea mediterranea TaxID=79327 RepID=A0A822ZV73_SCHMD|nr:TPA_exp: forkhead box A [Schmidtea mediterranea]
MFQYLNVQDTNELNSCNVKDMMNYSLNSKSFLTQFEISNEYCNSLTNESFPECFSAKSEDLTNDKPVKPPYSYITLISIAIRSSPNQKQTLNGIYDWIRKHFAYFKLDTQRWQNSIRHALSFNDCFIKLARPIGESGKGCYWAIHPEAKDHFQFGSLLRRYKKFTQSDRNHKIWNYFPYSHQASAIVTKNIAFPYNTNDRFFYYK